MKALKKTALLTAAGIIASASFATAANAAVVYSDDFEGTTSVTGDGVVVTTTIPDVTGFVGNAWVNNAVDGSANLSLTGLAPHNSVTVSFDLAILDTWDGNLFPDIPAFSPDFFTVEVDGGTVYRGLANNVNGFSSLENQTLGFRGEFNGNNSLDSTYRFSITFAHTSDTLDLAIFGEFLQGVADENWAIDNLLVETSASEVPLPAAAWFMASGVAAYAASRRKKS